MTWAAWHVQGNDGIVAVYLMLFLRLGLPERTHLMEYGVLAIFIHMALTERNHQGGSVPRPAVLAWIAAFLIGVIDETLQLFLPARVFDSEDILFNGIAVSMAIGGSTTLAWARRRVGKGA